MMQHYSPLGEIGLFDYPAEKVIWDGLRERWPQLNEHSKISYTPYREVQLASVEPFNISVVDNMERVKVSGWKRLKAMLFYQGDKLIWTGEKFGSGKLVKVDTLQVLDDPAERAKYVRRLWKAMLTAPVPEFWRVIGTLTRNQQRYNRGTELTIKAVMPASKYETLRLERYGANIYGDVFIIDCVYHVATDTLYVRK